MTGIHQAAIDACYDQALKSYNEGGLPIGSALTRGDEIIAVGHNRRMQQGNPILHGEMDCLQNAGRQASYRDCTLYTSLSPCMMCSGTIVQFKIPRVVICENRNFGGNEQFLRNRGVEVEIIDDAHCIDLMARFISESGQLWAEDIAD
ncbi:nucleoside deaminase [Novosphingobium album (ex Hu et al. 2023)]|uniref:Nucleoside deaminase n=1 Tax=Novosphingobium album (ex Hu et al. 2023) TaxID=2930093 RepID=A0ABT0AW93_9SPHN|nr:nucleoside deaminase [Novosphingobium album (ex Hu et al. 2023)]MCJ2177035.1 nucleoside deaminase [Novosphingobium album (ex Hu et al. 2023)]